MSMSLSSGARRVTISLAVLAVLTACAQQPTRDDELLAGERSGAGPFASPASAGPSTLQLALNAAESGHWSRAQVAFADALRDDVQAFAAGAEPADDLTVLAIRWNGKPGIPRSTGR